jgi:2-polyprenyl-3-methyl-5-hydroxy-6-metoxy-1,4-benzoquinol methylase
MSIAINDLGMRSLVELDEMHYDCELHYRVRIMSSRYGSPERSALFAEAYESLAEILGERRRRSGSPMGALGLAPDAAEKIADFLGPPPARLLDIGCGTGVLVQAMIARGYEANGIDVCQRLIATGLERMGRDAGPDGRLRCGDFLREDMARGGPYDLVHSNDVLEHIHPDEAADFARKSFELLRPGGLLWLITPNRWAGPGDATKLRHPPGTPTRGLHLKEYTLGELVSLLRGAGLWTGGRLRRATAFRQSFARVKLAVEPLLAAMPPRPRRRIIGLMDYACILARKPADSAVSAG